MALIKSQVIQSIRTVLAVSGTGLLAATVVTVGLWLLSDTLGFVSPTNTEPLRFRNLGTAWKPHRRMMLTIHQITIQDEYLQRVNELTSALNFKFNFSRFSGNARVETSSRIITAGYPKRRVIAINQKLPIAAYSKLDERALFFTVGSDEALGVDIYAMSEHWSSGARCPDEEGAQHYFNASNRFGLGTHTLRHQCSINGLPIEYSVDYTIQEWDPRLTIHEVWLGAGGNSGICYQAANQGSTSSWYYQIDVYASSADTTQPIVSSPPLYPLEAGQEIAGCLGLPRLETHVRDSLRVELKQLYDSEAMIAHEGG